MLKNQNCAGISKPWEPIRVIRIAQGNRPRILATKNLLGEILPRAATKLIRSFGNMGKTNEKKKNIIPWFSAIFCQ